MREKWERQPQRIGMILGFVAVPLGWFAQELLLHLVFGFRSSLGLEPINYFAAGALPGVILGSGVSKAALAWRRGERSGVKWHLLSHSTAVLVLALLLLEPTVWNPQRWSGTISLFGHLMPRPPTLFLDDILLNLPLQLALLMLFIGLLMNGRR